MWYLKTPNYDLQYIAKEDVDEFFTLTFRYYDGPLNIKICTKVLSFLGGVHPLFLSLARRIIFGLPFSNGDIKMVAEAQFIKSVYGQYMYLLKDLHLDDHKRLFLHLTEGSPIDIYSDQILKLGTLEYNGHFKLFSEHFTKFYIENYYPDYINK